MLRPRVIPCLLVHKNGLVKTIGFSNPKYVGDPINTVKIFNEKLVDELMVLDIDASILGKDPDYKMIENIASESRMPLCYGGGIKTVEQAIKIIGLGIEKIAISSAAIEKIELITQIASAVGSQSVVVVIDIKVGRSGKYEVWTHNGRVNSGRLLHDLVIDCQKAGCGEIVLNSIDNDGLMQGYNHYMVEHIWDFIEVPLTILGGAGSIKDINKLVKRFGIIGAAAGSMFVFQGIYRAVLISYPSLTERNQLFCDSLHDVEIS
jgi:cyclase